MRSLLAVAEARSRIFVGPMSSDALINSNASPRFSLSDPVPESPSTRSKSEPAARPTGHSKASNSASGRLCYIAFLPWQSVWGSQRLSRIHRESFFAPPDRWNAVRLHRPGQEAPAYWVPKRIGSGFESQAHRLAASNCLRRRTNCLESIRLGLV